jgi:hypothetical protein
MIQKIREATGLLATNFLLFSAIVLTVWLPGSILLVYLRLYVFPGTAGGDELRVFAQEFRVSNAIELAFGPLYVGAILYAASQLKQGLRPTYREAMAHASRRSFKLLGARIMAGLITLAGLIALIIPGIVLALRLALIDAVVVLDNVEGKSARNLSAKLTQGKRWNILGAMILTFIWLVIVISITFFILYTPLSLIGQEENFFVAVLAECISNVFLVIPTLVLFLFYWDAKSAQTRL